MFWDEKFFGMQKFFLRGINHKSVQKSKQGKICSARQNCSFSKKQLFLQKTPKITILGGSKKILEFYLSDPSLLDRSTMTKLSAVR